MKSLIPDWLPKLFVKAEGSVREATTKKFSDFNKITDTDGMEVVGIKNGANVRADFPLPTDTEAGPLTTSMIQTEPDDVLRNSKGQFMATKELPELSTQKDVNRFLWEQITNIEIPEGGGEVDLSDYATIEYVDQTEIDVLNAAIKVAKDGDAELQAQIDELEAPDLTGYATEEWVGEQIDAIEFPEGADLTGYATEQWVGEQIEAIEFPETDLTGYATEDYVDETVGNLATQIPSLDGYATEEYVGEEISKIVHPEYDDSGIKQDLSDETAARIAGDNTLQAEITELALAVDTLLVQQVSGKWKYIGSIGFNVPRNDGELAMLSSELSSPQNGVVLREVDLDGNSNSFSDIEVGDYIEIVAVDDPDKFILMTVAREPDGTGLVQIDCDMKKSGKNFDADDVLELRFFQINEQSLDLTELDARYAQKDHTHPEFAELQGEIDDIWQSLDAPDITDPPPEGQEDYRRKPGWLYVQGNKLTSGSSLAVYLYNDGTNNITSATEFDINRGMYALDGTTTIFTEWDEVLKEGEWLNFFVSAEDAFTETDTYVDVQVGPFISKINGANGYDGFRFNVKSIRATPALIAEDQTRVNKTNKAVQMNYGLRPSNFATLDQLDAAIDGVTQYSDFGDARLQNQIDFMAQEINHLIPIKDEGQWKAQSSYSTSGNVKFNSSAYYGPWGENIDRIYFNHTGADGIDHSPLLTGMEAGDKFECFIDKTNYCVFQVTRLSQYNGYTLLYVTPTKFEGAGYKVNDILTFEFFQTADNENLPRTILEEMAGHYLYSQAKIADQIKLDTLHEHPGKFLCIDSNGLIMDYQFGDVKFIHFAPVDANGNRPPCEKTSSTGLKKFCWEVTTRVVKSGQITPSFQYTPKSWDRSFLVGQVYTQAAQNIPTIKFHPDDAVVYKYEAMGDDQWWRWPV